MMTKATEIDVAPAATGAARGTGRPGLNADVARGIADGFAEASRAFSDELADTTSCGGLAEGLVAGILRANSQFLDELAFAARRVTQGVAQDLGEREQDINRLTDLVAKRLSKEATPAGGTGGIDYEHLADLVAARLRGTASACS